MSEHTSFDVGTVGGILAAAFTGLIALGHGVQWLLNWKGKREESRAAKLQAWHDELKAREAEFDERVAKWAGGLEQRVQQQDGQIRALRLAFELVAAPLRALDPDNASLSRAEKLLEAAFPLDPAIPPTLGKTLAALD